MCAITPPKNIAIIAIVGVAIASSLCERVLVFGGHYATPGITRTDTVARLTLFCFFGYPFSVKTLQNHD
jgi:hypothetical protein